MTCWPENTSNVVVDQFLDGSTLKRTSRPTTYQKHSLSLGSQITKWASSFLGFITFSDRYYFFNIIIITSNYVGCLQLLFFIIIIIINIIIIVIITDCHYYCYCSIIIINIITIKLVV